VVEGGVWRVIWWGFRKHKWLGHVDVKKKGGRTMVQCYILGTRVDPKNSKFQTRCILGSS
jgi:hypothetical protein